jgi:flagellar biogenesis protein FliO
VIPVRCLLQLGQAALLCVGVCAMPVAAAQHLGHGDDPGVSIVRILAALLLIFALAALALYLGRGRMTRLRLWTPPDGRRIRVIETVRVAPGATLCLASLDDSEFLLAVTSSGATLIAESAIPRGNEA